MFQATALLPALLWGCVVLALAPGLPALAADCPAGSQAVGFAVENRSGGAVTVALRQARSQDAWVEVAVAPGARADLAVCLQMVLSVGSAEYRVLDEAGTALCENAGMIAAGQTPLLVLSAEGGCALDSAH